MGFGLDWDWDWDWGNAMNTFATVIVATSTVPRDIYVYIIIMMVSRLLTRVFSLSFSFSLWAGLETSDGAASCRFSEEGRRTSQQLQGYENSRG